MNVIILRIQQNSATVYEIGNTQKKMKRIFSFYLSFTSSSNFDLALIFLVWCFIACCIA